MADGGHLIMVQRLSFEEKVLLHHWPDAQAFRWALLGLGPYDTKLKAGRQTPGYSRL